MKYKFKDKKQKDEKLFGFKIEKKKEKILP